MNISLIQFSPEWENKFANIEKIDLMLVDTQDSELIILPEMSLIGFSMNSDLIAEEIDGISIKYFIQKSRELKKHIFAGIVERHENQIYNSLFHFDNMGLIKSIYRKIHPFSLAKENNFYFSSNETVYTEINHIKFGLSICYDLRFPELYRFYAKQKCEVLVNIANWPVKRINHWDALARARAIENLSYFIGVNRTGIDENGFEYNGHSQIISPMGDVEIISKNEERVITHKIDLNIIAETRSKLNFLEDIKLI